MILIVVMLNKIDIEIFKMHPNWTQEQIPLFHLFCSAAFYILPYR